MYSEAKSVIQCNRSRESRHIPFHIFRKGKFVYDLSSVYAELNRVFWMLDRLAWLYECVRGCYLINVCRILSRNGYVYMLNLFEVFVYYDVSGFIRQTTCPMHLNHVCSFLTSTSVVLSLKMRKISGLIYKYKICFAAILAKIIILCNGCRHYKL